MLNLRVPAAEVKPAQFDNRKIRPMTSVPRTLARLMTGLVYVLLGLNAVHAPGARAATAGPILATIRRAAPLPEDDELIVRGNAAVQVAGGALLAAGVLPPLSALALVGSMVPTTLAGHAYWRIEDPVARKMQRVQLAKNVAMIGGLLLVATDRSGPGSSGKT